MPDENRIIDLKGFFNSDGTTYNPFRGREIIRKVELLMGFPNDTSIREELFTQSRIGVVTFRGGVKASKLQRLQRLRRQEKRNMHKASFAGTILADVFEDHRRFPEKFAGVNAAIKRMVEYDDSHPRSVTKMLEGEPVPVRLPPKQQFCERTFLTWWTKYKAVAHLFAALGHHPANPKHKNIVPKRRYNPDHFKPVNFPGFLALAKMYQDFAVNYTPARAREPLILKDEIWWIEPDFELPTLEIRHPQQISR